MPTEEEEECSRNGGTVSNQVLIIKYNTLTRLLRCDRQIWQIWSFWWKSRQRWLRGTYLESFHIAKMGSEQIKQIWSVWGKLECLWQFWESHWKYENHVADKYEKGDTINDCLGQIWVAFTLQRSVQEFKVYRFVQILLWWEFIFFDMKHFLNVFNIADIIRL